MINDQQRKATDVSVQRVYIRRNKILQRQVGGNKLIFT